MRLRYRTDIISLFMLLNEVRFRSLNSSHLASGGGSRRWITGVILRFTFQIEHCSTIQAVLRVVLLITTRSIPFPLFVRLRTDSVGSESSRMKATSIRPDTCLQGVESRTPGQTATVASLPHKLCFAWPFAPSLPPVAFITPDRGSYSFIGHRMMDGPLAAGRHVGGENKDMSQRGRRRSESPSPSAALSTDSGDSDFLSNIFAPGSSLNPTFLLVVDVVLALLSLTLGSLAIVTGGNVHLIALLFITLALWVSIKW